MYTENFPTWALCYAVNGDADNLTSEEITQIDEALQGLELVSVGEQEFFTWLPMFGPACMCIEATLRDI